MEKPITEGTERQFILRLPQVRKTNQIGAHVLFMVNFYACSAEHNIIDYHVFFN